MNFGEAVSAVPTFALEAPMTHNLNHREQPVQKAGQKAGAAQPPSPNPTALFREGTKRDAWHRGSEPQLRHKDTSHFCASAPEESGGVDRVAGGETLSQKTSTAALDSFRCGPFSLQRRAPRHRLFVGPAFRGRPFRSSATSMPHLWPTQTQTQFLAALALCERISILRRKP
jgi:hypothetical protein